MRNEITYLLYITNSGREGHLSVVAIQARNAKAIDVPKSVVLYPCEERLASFLLKQTPLLAVCVAA